MPEGSLASSVGGLDKTNNALLDRPKTQLWLRYSPVIPYSYKQNLHTSTATGRFEASPVAREFVYGYKPYSTDP